jgi:hypothetical protein
MTAVSEKAEFGLNGGIYLNGAINAIATSSQGYSVGYVYYPISASVADIKMLGITSGSSISYTGSVPVYGPITEVSQSSGQAFIYFGNPEFIYPPKQVS